MATIDKYVIELDVQGQQAVDRLKNSLGGLGGVIAGIGIGAFIHSIMELGDAISDLSDATGLSIGNIARLREGMEAAGGEAENAGKMITSFYQAVDKAAQGTEASQKALEKVGITFDDLSKLSEKDLLSKALKTLSEMPAGAERTAAGMEVLGKAFRNINPQILEEAFRSGNFDQAEEALKKMGDLADKTKANMLQLQMAGAQVFSSMLSALEPLIGKVEEGRLSFEQAEKAIKLVGVAIGIAFGIKVVTTIADIVKIMQSLNAAMKANVAIQTALQALQGPKGWAVLAGSAVAATAAIIALNKAMDENGEKTGAKPGETPTAQPEPTGPARKTQFYSDEELKARKVALTTAEQTTQQLIQQNTEAQKYQTIINGTIGMMTEQADRVKATAQLEQDAHNKILDLNKQIEVEKSKGRGTNQGVIDELQKQKAEVEKNLEATKKLKLEELERLQALTKQRMELETQGMRIQNQLDNQKQTSAQLIQDKVIGGSLTQEQAARETELSNIRLDGLKKVEALQNQIARSTSQIEKDELQNRISLEQEQTNVMITQAKTRYEQIDKLRQSSEAGAISALEQLTRSVDPFVLAQNRVNTLFSSMTSSIDKFVETGKFSFTDFSNSIIRDILKVELKASATKLFTSAFGKGGVFSNLLGFETGGTPPVGVPSIVGERGPELFIPNTPGKIVPTNQISKSGIGDKIQHNTYITNNISAVDAQSVARLFAENRKTLLGSVKMAEKEMPYKVR